MAATTATRIEEESIIVNLKLPNKRVYEIAWSICLLKGYQNADELVSDIVLDRIEMYPDGRAVWQIALIGGFKTKEEGAEEQQQSQRGKARKMKFG